MRTKIFNLFLLMSVALHAQAGFFGGFDGSATIFEQLIQSGILNNQLGKQASMVIQQATMIQNQLEHKNELLLLNKSQDPAVMNNLLNQNRHDIDSLQTYIGGLTTIRNDSEQQRSAAQARLLDIKQSGLSYSEYEQMERDRIAAGDRRRAQRVAHEIAIMQNVSNDAQFIQEMQNKIPATVGAHEATQLMNVQLNRIIAQNATMIQLMASSNSQHGNDEAQDGLNIPKTNESRLTNANQQIKNFGETQRIGPSTVSNTPSNSTGQNTSSSLINVLNPQ